MVDIGVEDGKIAEISSLGLRGERVIDAGGRLVTEPFVNPHLHLCKVYTFHMIGDQALQFYQEEKMTKASEAIFAASEIKKRYKEDWVYANAKKALFEALKHGCLFLRAFVDTDTIARLEAVKAVLRLKQELADVLTIQVVAFPQEGVVRDPGAEELVWKAVEMGCDVVGGIPWIENSPKEQRLHVDKMFEIAKAFNRDVAMLTDDAGDPSLRTTEMLVRKALEEKWVGRVSAHHSRAMALYEEGYLEDLIQLLRMTEANIVSNPHTGPLHAPVKKLIDRGVNVALGQDDVADAYYPFGRNKMLEVAFLASHILRMLSKSDIMKLFNMITFNAAKAMRIPRYTVEKGSDATFIILDAESIHHAFATQADPLYILRRGEIILERHEEIRLDLRPHG